MPKKPQIQKKKKSVGLTRAQYEHLIFGYNMLNEVVPWHNDLGFPFKDERHRRKLWVEHRDQLLKKCEQGARPSGWWDYQSTERRRVVAGDPERCMWDHGTWMGKCKVVDISGPNDPDRPVFESQKQYLDRLKL